MSSKRYLSSSVESSSSSHLNVPSPNPNPRRWTPLSHHGLPKSPGTYSSTVSSPTSVATPSTIGSNRSSSGQNHGHHRFDSLGDRPSAYSEPSYTQSVTLMAPPPGGKGKHTRDGSSSSSAGFKAVDHAELQRQLQEQERERERGLVLPTRKRGFYGRLLEKLGCGENQGARDKQRRPQREPEDVIRIEKTHWTEA